MKFEQILVILMISFLCMSCSFSMGKKIRTRTKTSSHTLAKEFSLGFVSSFKKSSVNRCVKRGGFVSKAVNTHMATKKWFKLFKMLSGLMITLNKPIANVLGEAHKKFKGKFRHLFNTVFQVKKRKMFLSLSPLPTLVKNIKKKVKKLLVHKMLWQTLKKNLLDILPHFAHIMNILSSWALILKPFLRDVWSCGHKKHTVRANLVHIATALTIFTKTKGKFGNEWPTFVYNTLGNWNNLEQTLKVFAHIFKSHDWKQKMYAFGRFTGKF